MSVKIRQWRSLNRLIISTAVILACLSASVAFAEEPDVDPARQEAMFLFPREIGVTAWYSANGGIKFKLVLDRVAYWSDKEEATLYFQGQSEGILEDNGFFRIGFRDAMVLENFPKELALPAEAQQLVSLQYPYDAGETWTQLITESKILVGTILSNEIDPRDHLRTVKVHYQMMSRSKDYVYYTAERTYKQGLGMVRMEVWDGAGELHRLQSR